MRALVTGWFSFEEMGATAGDLLVRDVVCGWLTEAGLPFDVALAPPFAGGVDWQTADPAAYSTVVFVCGPFGNGWPVTELLKRFSSARLVGVDLSLLQPLTVWNPFQLLLERDSDRTARPDVSFLSRTAPVPVVGLVLVEPQREYEASRHVEVNALIERELATRDVAVVAIDTRLDKNATGLRTPAQVESMIARVNVVVTTRLHGLVLALKNGVPAVAVDAVLGGAKVARQASVLGWPHVLVAGALTDASLGAVLDECLTESARDLARRCAAAARRDLGPTRAAFVYALGAD